MPVSPPRLGRTPWARKDGQPDRRKRGRAGQRDRKRRMERSGGLCQRCLDDGRTVVATIVNHIVPLAHGGPDTDENTENLCGGCDERVTAKQFGYRLDKGVDAAGRPAFADHPWNRPSGPR